MSILSPLLLMNIHSIFGLEIGKSPVYIYHSNIIKAPESIRLEYAKWARKWYSFGYLPSILSEAHAIGNSLFSSINNNTDCIHRAQAIEKIVSESANKEILYANVNGPLLTINKENLLHLLDCKSINDENFPLFHDGFQKKRNIAILQPQFHLPIYLEHRLGNDHVTFISDRNEIDESWIGYDKIILMVQHPFISPHAQFELSRALLGPLALMERGGGIEDKEENGGEMSKEQKGDFSNNDWKIDLEKWLKARKVTIVIMDDPIASHIAMDYQIGAWRPLAKNMIVPEPFRALSKSSSVSIPQLKAYEDEFPKEAKLYKMLREHFEFEFEIIKSIEENILGFSLYQN